MVAQKIKNAIPWAAVSAVAGVAFLIAMVITGALPTQRQLVKFEPKGVMKLDPDRVSRVEIRRGEGMAALLRAPGGWTVARSGRALPAELSKKLSLAVQFMNTAGPIRVLEPVEIDGTKARDFGLDPPRVACTLFAGAQEVLGARFGAHNPDDTAQYMMLDGRNELYLMSRFVGQEWESVADEVLAK